jgi:diacylglycerol kinase (ATP)
VALDVHNMRETHPEWFFSQMGNKMWYTGLGAGESLNHSCGNLAAMMTVECDGKHVAIPPDAEGILVLNINSFMGGVELWQADSSSGAPLPPQSMHDQLLEVVSRAFHHS